MVGIKIHTFTYFNSVQILEFCCYLYNFLSFNFFVDKISTSKNCRNLPKSILEPLKLFLHVLLSSKLISRKIWVAVKFKNFHTVPFIIKTSKKWNSKLKKCFLYLIVQVINAWEDPIFSLYYYNGPKILLPVLHC